ncbi:MAG: polymer-forming cytoskeletal protein [Pseudomonadota bacterium]
MKLKEKFIAYLGKDTEFQGLLRFLGTIMVDGHVKGRIFATGTLFVGQEGIIEANMRVPRVVVRGEVRGNIIAEERIEIRGAGRVIGDILTPKLLIEEGAVFEGSCWMQKAPEPFEQDWELVSSEGYVISPPKDAEPIYGVSTNREEDEPVRRDEVKVLHSRIEQKKIEVKVPEDHAPKKGPTRKQKIEDIDINQTE